MDHLEARGTLAHLAEAADVHAGLELRLLLPREVKETQGELARAVADANEQVASPPVNRLGEQHLARDQAALPRLQPADRHEPGAVLVTKRQQE